MTHPDLSSVLASAWDTAAHSVPDAGASERARLTGRVRSRRRRAQVGRAAAVTAASGVVVVGGLGVANAIANRGENVAPATPSALDDASLDGAPPNAPATLLLVRTDGLGDDPNAGLIVDPEPGPRLDGLALVHIAQDGTRVELVALYPRAIVDAPACELANGAEVPAATARLAEHAEAAFHQGTFADGVACIEATVAHATGIDLDGVVVTDLAGFIEGADAVGGAEVCVPEAIAAAHAQLSLDRGLQRLPGRDLLALARARTGTGLGGGDEAARAEREARVLAALAQSANDDAAANGTGAAQALLDGAYVTGVAADAAWLKRAGSALTAAPGVTFVPVTVPLQIDAGGEASWSAGARDVFGDLAADRPVDSAAIATVSCDG